MEAAVVAVRQPELAISPAVLTRRQCAAYMGFGWTRWREQVEPELPRITHGQNVLTRVKDADAWLAKPVRNPSRHAS